MKKMPLLPPLVIVLLLVAGGGIVPETFHGTFPGGGLGVVIARAEEGWRTELEDVCSRTGDAASFSRLELKALIERCDRLKPRIDALEESSRKVFGRRLQMCRQLYAFVLENNREAEKQP